MELKSIRRVLTDLDILATPFKQDSDRTNSARIFHDWGQASFLTGTYRFSVKSVRLDNMTTFHCFEH